MNKQAVTLDAEQAKIIKVYEEGFSLKLPFPQTFQKLQATKLSSYEVTTATGEHVFKIGIRRFYAQYGAPDVANAVKTYSKDAAYQVLINHAKSGSTFQNFLTKLAAAGVALYTVNIKTGICTYYSQGKLHSFTEEVPQFKAVEPASKDVKKKVAPALAKTNKSDAPSPESAIIEVFRNALKGAPYKTTFNGLKKLGVTYYVAHIGRDIYEFHTASSRYHFNPHGKRDEAKAIGTYDAKKVKLAIKAKHVDYNHLVAALLKAGVYEYEVSITDKTCTYYGKDRSNHIVEKITLK